jgi:hypothetical protein
VQLRDLTEPGVSITEQRLVAGATTPTEMLARRVGEPVTVVTPKGEVSGVLRAIDDGVMVLEIGSGDGRRVSMIRRDYALDVRFGGAVADKPTLVWRIATRKPGKHTIELAYRATGLTWSTDYLAVLDEPGKQIDFSAWATIKNATGATFDSAEITLVSGGTTSTGIAGLQPRPVPTRFTLPRPVRIGSCESVQVELTPPVLRSKIRPITVFEAMTDPSAQQQGIPNIECTAYNGTGLSGRAEIAIELDVPTQTPLPDGRVRLFRRKGTRLEVVSEDKLRSAAGLARIRLSPDPEITGERRAVTCNVDERARTMQEKLEVKLENRAAQAADVVIREYMWRWPVWRLEGENRKGVRAGPQVQEYRVRVPAKGTQTVTYTAIYSW